MRVSKDDLRSTYQATGEIMNMDPLSAIKDCVETKGWSWMDRDQRDRGQRWFIPGEGLQQEKDTNR